MKGGCLAAVCGESQGGPKGDELRSEASGASVQLVTKQLPFPSQYVQHSLESMTKQEFPS